MGEKVVPLVEKQLGVTDLSYRRRALMGCSLSGLMTTRVCLLQPGLFGMFVVGSPSLHLEPSIFDVAKKHGKEAAAAKPSVFFIAGAEEGNTKDPTSGNKIPYHSQKMAE